MRDRTVYRKPTGMVLKMYRAHVEAEIVYEGDDVEVLDDGTETEPGPDRDRTHPTTSLTG